MGWHDGRQAMDFTVNAASGYPLMCGPEEWDLETAPPVNQVLPAWDFITGAYCAFAMVGRSHAMKEIFKTIGMVAKSPATVLITGESGTGKELVARAIHRNSDKPNGPFVAVNCAALVLPRVVLEKCLWC